LEITNVFILSFITIIVDIPLALYRAEGGLSALRRPGALLGDIRIA
jgi:hypothetical protein